MRIRNRAGEALPAVSVRDITNQFSGATDERGELELPPTPVSWIVESPGYERFTGAFVADATGWVDLTLNPGGIARGVVVDTFDEPLADVRVRAALPMSDAPPWTTTTDAPGRFEFTTLPVATVVLEASRTTYGATYRQVPVATDAGTEVRIILHRTATVAGTVRTMNEGPPAAGAIVTIAGSGIWPARSVEADGAGQYRIQGIPDGIYELRAHKGDYVATPVMGVALEAGEEREIDLVLSVGAGLTGVVVAASDLTPIAGARVVINEDAVSMSPRATATGAEGAFRIAGLRPGEHWLSVEAEGFVTIEAQPVTVGGEPVRIEMRTASIIEGRVIDGRGFPISTARVSILGTGDNDHPVQLAGGFEQFRSELFEVQSTGAFPMASSGELGVTLGEVPPIPLTPVDLAGPADDLGSVGAIVSTSWFVTDDMGRFRITGVPPGEMEVVAQRSSYAVARSNPIFVDAGSRHQGIEIIMVPSGEIEGRVVDNRGFPVGLVPVEMRGELEAQTTIAVTNDAGEFHFEDAAGHVVLTARPVDLPPVETQVEVESGQTSIVEITLDAALYRISGRSTDARAFPVAGARITLRSLNAQNPMVRWTTSGNDGAFEFNGLPAPPYRIEAEHDHYARTTRDLETADSAIVLAFQGGAEVRGRIVDEYSSQPLANVVVTLRPSDAGENEAMRAVTDESGGFVFAMVGPGQYDLETSMDGYVAHTQSVAHAEGPRGLYPQTLDDIRLVPGGSISGVVVDAIGDPVPGATVAIGSPPEWSESVRTNARGEFLIASLPESHVTVTARHPGAGEIATEDEIRVRVGEDASGIRLSLPERYHPEDVTVDSRMRTGVPITLRDQGDSVLIASVLRGSSAARAGLRPGDELTSVDGENVLDVPHGAGLLLGPNGDEAILVIRRGGHERRMIVVRESYRP